jgi:hypothetical protein
MRSAALRQSPTLRFSAAGTGDGRRVPGLPRLTMRRRSRSGKNARSREECAREPSDPVWPDGRGQNRTLSGLPFDRSAGASGRKPTVSPRFGACRRNFRMCHPSKATRSLAKIDRCAAALPVCASTIDLDAYALTLKREIWLDTHSFLTDCIRWAGNFVFGYSS